MTESTSTDEPRLVHVSTVQTQTTHILSLLVIQLEVTVPEGFNVRSRLRLAHDRFWSANRDDTLQLDARRHARLLERWFYHVMEAWFRALSTQHD